MQMTMPQILPAIMGHLRQEQAEGVLILEQNDGTRRLYWEKGSLVHLQSEVAGEQFGNYLLRQGILDFPALSELLANDERWRLGEKVIQWGLMSREERDLHLGSLQEQVMIHALEHPVLEMVWDPCTIGTKLSDDLHFRVEHRRFVWSTFQEAGNLGDLCDLLYDEGEWRWIAPPDLLGTLADLPLNPQVAYALSFLGAEPVGFETFISLSGMDDHESARLLGTLWALGALTLIEGKRPTLRTTASLPVMPPPVAEQAPVPEAIPEPPPPTVPEPLPPAPVKAGVPELIPQMAIPELPDLTAMVDAPEPVRQGEDPVLRARKFLVKAKHLAVQDRTAEAVRLLEECVRLDPDSEQAYEPWLLLGRCRISNPAWSTRAIEALQAASRIKPKTAEPWALMGELYHRKGFKANARACFRRALDLDPSVAVPAEVDLHAEDTDPGMNSIFNRVKRAFGRKE